MRATRISLRSILAICFAAMAANSCGGSPQPAPAAPPPTPVVAPPPASTPTPSASVAPQTPPPAEAQPAQAKNKHSHMKHHPMLGMLMADVEQLGLRPEQQGVVNLIQADLEKQADAFKEPHAQLSNDLADGVAAGKLDKAKLDADTKKLVQAGEASVKAVQDAANKLHQTLDAGQRKKLVELMRAKSEEMRAHGMGPMPGHGPGEHGMPAPKGEPGKAPPSGAPATASSAAKPEAAMAPQGPGAPGAPHHGPGDHAMGHHEPGGPGMGHPGMHPQWGMDKLSETLSLTQEQRDKLKAKMDAQMKSHMGAMKAEHAAMEKRMKAIADAFESDKFDAKKAGIGEKHGDMIKNMVKARVEFVEMVLSVLTPEQRAKFAEHVKQHCEMCDEPE